MTDERAGRPVLVTGAPHSGTKYMAHLLQRFGLDVGHEKPGRDGMSAFAWAVDDIDPRWCGGERRPDNLSGWYVLHVVRDPLLVIAAIECGPKHALGPEPNRHLGHGPVEAAFLRRHLPPEPPRGWVAHRLLYACELYIAFAAGAEMIAERTVLLSEAPSVMERVLGHPPSSLPSTTTNTQVNGGRVPTTYERIAAACGQSVADSVRHLHNACMGSVCRGHRSAA